MGIAKRADRDARVRRRTPEETLAYHVIEKGLKDAVSRTQQHRESAEYFFESGDYVQWARICGMDEGMLMDAYREVKRKGKLDLPRGGRREALEEDYDD